MLKCGVIPQKITYCECSLCIVSGNVLKHSVEYDRVDLLFAAFRLAVVKLALVYRFCIFTAVPIVMTS